MLRRGFDDLLAFIAVARAGSFTKAAARLGGPIGVEPTIRGLEARLGVRSPPQTPHDLAGHDCIGLRLPTHDSLYPGSWRRPVTR